MSTAEQQRIVQLEAELAAMKLKEQKRNARGIEIKVSQKGCVQINGIRKFPFTFYKEEIEKILSMREELESFIENNISELSTKN